MEKDYKKTGWVNGSEPDMDAEHMNNIEDGIDGLYHPVFDDSGTVEGITNFPQFLSTVVNKMNPIAFYKNFKAGMAFVLHAGQLVNNGLCNEPGKYPLDAAYGKTLYDYYDRLNSDFGDLNENTNLLAHGLSPTDYDLLNWATDNPFRRQIWKITDRNMTGTPDDTKEWCCLNFQDSDHSRGVIMAIEYGMGTRICTRIYYNKEWLTEWASLRN